MPSSYKKCSHTAPKHIDQSVVSHFGQPMYHQLVLSFLTDQIFSSPTISGAIILLFKILSTLAAVFGKISGSGGREVFSKIGSGEGSSASELGLKSGPL